MLTAVSRLADLDFSGRFGRTGPRAALVVPILAVAIWAANTVVSRSAAGVIDPVAMTFYRWAVAAIALTPFCAARLWRRRAEMLPYLGRMGLLAFVGMVLNQLLTYEGAHTTTAMNMGLIFALIPSLGLVLGRTILAEAITLGALTGVAVSFAGVVIICVAGRPGSFGSGGMNLGDLLILSAAAAYALYTVLLRRWTSARFDTWLVLYVQVLIATVMLAPVTALADSMAVPPRAFGLVLFAGVGASLVGGYFWVLGVRLLGSARAAITMNLMPLFTAAMAHQFLGESIRWYHWGGGFLILAGVLLSQRASATPRDNRKNSLEERTGV